MDLTSKQQAEIISLQKIIKQCEGVVRISQDSTILKRVKIDLKQAKNRLSVLCPDGVPSALVQTNRASSEKLTLEAQIKNYSMLSQFPIHKISPSCENDDINLLATIVQTWDILLSPVVSNQHITLEFSVASDRTAFHTDIESLKWQMKTLADSIENYATSVRQESKEQLREIKNHQSRSFITVGSNFLKKLNNFWSQIYQDALDQGTLCLNPDEKVHFSSNLEALPLMESPTVINVLKMLTVYLSEALTLLNPPNIKKTI